MPPFTRTRLGTLFVIAQFLLFALYCLPIHWFTSFAGYFSLVGGVLIAAGIAIGSAALYRLRKQFSPFPSPAAGAHLMTDGVFSFARHPIYTGILMAGFGGALFTGSVYRLLMVLVLTILFYFKSAYEEQLLTARFPEYATYAQRVGRFISLSQK